MALKIINEYMRYFQAFLAALFVLVQKSAVLLFKENFFKRILVSNTPVKLRLK